MTTDRSLLMRVLLLPHGNGSNPELDALCADILAHCMKTLPDGRSYNAPADTDWIRQATDVALLRADGSAIMRRAWSGSFPITFPPTPDGIHGDAVWVAFLDDQNRLIRQTALSPTITIWPGMTAQVCDGGFQ